MPFEPVVILHNAELIQLREADLDFTEQPLAWAHFAELKQLIEVTTNTGTKPINGVFHACALMKTIIRLQETNNKLLLKKYRGSRTLLECLREQGVQREILENDTLAPEQIKALSTAVETFKNQRAPVFRHASTATKKPSKTCDKYYRRLSAIILELLNKEEPDILKPLVNLNEYVKNQFIIDACRTAFFIYDASHPNGYLHQFKSDSINPQATLFEFFSTNYQLSDEQIYTIGYTLPQGTFGFFLFLLHQFFCYNNHGIEGNFLTALPIQLTFDVNKQLTSIIFSAVHGDRKSVGNKQERTPYAYSYVVLKPTHGQHYDANNISGTLPLAVSEFAVYAKPEKKALFERWIQDIQSAFTLKPKLKTKPKSNSSRTLIVSLSAVGTSLLTAGIVVGLFFTLPLMGVSLPVIIPTLATIAILAGIGVGILLVAAGLGAAISYGIHRLVTRNRSADIPAADANPAPEFHLIGTPENDVLARCQHIYEVYDPIHGVKTKTTETLSTDVSSTEERHTTPTHGQTGPEPQPINPAHVAASLFPSISTSKNEASVDVDETYAAPAPH
jgi:hypothetical protein